MDNLFVKCFLLDKNNYNFEKLFNLNVLNLNIINLKTKKLIIIYDKKNKNLYDILPIKTKLNPVCFLNLLTKVNKQDCIKAYFKSVLYYNLINEDNYKYTPICPKINQPFSTNFLLKMLEFLQI